MRLSDADRTAILMVLHAYRNQENSNATNRIDDIEAIFSEHLRGMLEALKQVAAAHLIYSEDRGVIGRAVIAAIEKAEGRTK